MNQATKKAAVVLLPILACSLLTCCVQLEQRATLFQGGMGKIQIVFGMKKSLVDLARAGDGEDPMAAFTDPLELEANSEGVVAWSRPTEKVVDDWVRVTTTAYFRNIKAVKLYKDETNAETGATRRELALSFDLEKKDGLTLLTVNNEMTKDMGKELGVDRDDAEGSEDAEEDPVADALLEMLKPMLEGLNFEVSVTVPGPIETIEGFTKYEGRTASMKIDDELLFAALTDHDSEAARTLERLESAGAARVGWRFDAVHASRVATFKKELADATAEWKKLLEAARKK